MGRLGNGEYSQTKRAIKWRANKALKNAAYLLEKQNTELIIEGGTVAPPKKAKQAKPAPDAIGVFPDDEPAAAPEPDPQAYFCENCRGTVHQGDAGRAGCEEGLNGAGGGRRSQKQTRCTDE